MQNSGDRSSYFARREILLRLEDRFHSVVDYCIEFIAAFAIFVNLVYMLSCCLPQPIREANTYPE